MIFLNNKLVKRKDALVSVFDHGFLYGDGIYETFRVYDGVVFMLQEHLERLFESASLIGLDIQKSRAAIKKAVYETLQANKLDEATIRLTVSRGVGPLGLDPALCKKPTFVIMVNPFKPYPSKFRRKGIALTVARTRRNYQGALDPRIKSLNFLNNILAKRESIARGTNEAIMLNHRGHLTEGTVSNLFFVRGGVLYTPSMKTGILEGITRKIIIGLATASGIKVKEGGYGPAALMSADEVFISNTSMEVMPVRSVDDHMVPVSPGNMTKLLGADYRKFLRKYKRSHAL
ncbi:MAG: aminotransferase class IV [Nitrospira sp.]|nr:aminotransferase class IV [Nitrospira sp.]